MAVNPRLSFEVLHSDRSFNLWHGLNIITATSDPRIASASLTVASQNTRFAAAPVIRGDVINTLGVYVSAAGTAVSLFKIGIWDKNGVQLGKTADLSASLAANTWLSGTLTTPVNIDYSGIVYLGITCVFATTSPTLAANSVLNSAQSILPSGGQITGANFGNADIPSPLVLFGTNVSATAPHVIAF